MMRALFIAAAMLVMLTAQAAEARKYAVISLIGDKLMLVTRDIATGSRIDQNRRQYVDVSTPALDNTALLAVEEALKTADPQAEVVLLATRDPAVFAAQARMLEKGGREEGLLGQIAKVAEGAQASHLVLVAKLRHEAMLRVRDGSVGSGWLEGLGFYVDRSMPMVNTDSGESYTGFLAPFAYFRLVLVDLSSDKVLGEESVVASTTHGRQDSFHPWDTMTAEQKVSVLQGLIRQETRRIVPRLLEGR